MNKHSHLENSEEDECYICLEIITKKQKIAKLKCSHKTHHKCYKKWVRSIHNKNGSKCPLCGAEYSKGSSRDFAECIRNCVIS
jgi:hypothetical protein